MSGYCLFKAQQGETQQERRLHFPPSLSLSDGDCSANQRNNSPESNIKSKVQAGTEGQYLDFYELFTIA